MEKSKISIDEINNAIKKIVEQIDVSGFKPEIIVSINRWGCIPGVYLSHYFKKPHNIIDVKSLKADSGNKFSLLINSIDNNKRILIIDDINDSGATLNYITGHDLAQGAGGKKLTYNCGNDNDQSLSGELMLFNPSSSTFVKHFLARVSNSHKGNYEKNTYTAGYYNTTSDIDAFKFFYSSGNIGSGTIKLYGIKDS